VFFQVFFEWIFVLHFLLLTENIASVNNKDAIKMLTLATRCGTILHDTSLRSAQRKRPTGGVKTMFKPNKFQTAIFDEVEHGTGNVVVLARAGTGKTTTALQALQHVKPGLRVLFCAFNKSIQKELEERVADLGLSASVDTRTLHSIGFGCVRKVGKVRVDADRTKKITRRYLEDQDTYITGRQAAIIRLVGLAKNTLTSDREDIEELAWQYNVGDEINPPHIIARDAQHILTKCEKYDGTIDFDDMVWLPAVHKWKPRTYDIVFVDEAQDLNATQLWLIDQLVRKSKARLIAVGDDRQAIYGFRGAGSSVIDDITDRYNAKVLPLSITYRCPKLVVDIAQEIVPDYIAADTAPDGIVNNIEHSYCATATRPGDFVLSRKNAPLMSMALAILSRGVPAVIAGRDIGNSLAVLAEKSKKRTVTELMAWLDSYQEKEQKRLLPDRESAFDTVCDKIECLKTLCEGEDKVAAVIDKIEQIFKDTDSSKHVICSSVHKAKGLEREHVFVLEDTFRRGYNDEEDNIFYVAITRAQKQLTFVQAEDE
jgi:superfamily I DNA/RNA helicase